MGDGHYWWILKECWEFGVWKIISLPLWSLEDQLNLKQPHQSKRFTRSGAELAFLQDCQQFSAPMYLKGNRSISWRSGRRFSEGIILGGGPRSWYHWDGAHTNHSRSQDGPHHHGSQDKAESTTEPPWSRQRMYHELSWPQASAPKASRRPRSRLSLSLAFINSGGSQQLQSRNSQR